MTRPARFLFDLDFSAPAPVPLPEAPARPTIDLDQHLAELVEVEERTRAEAFAEGREEGFLAGRTDAEARAAERLADEAGAIADAARRLLEALDAERAAVEETAVELAVAVARRFAEGLLAAEPLAETRALLAGCLGPLRRAPHLAIRLPAADADRLKPMVDRLVRETGFEGRVVILGEDDVKRGDCRIEWADGGIVRDGDAIAGEVDAAVARWLAARHEGRARGTDLPADDRRRTDP
jgi:flagellar assembly protein FliH